GLRTLVLAARPLPDRAWYEGWAARHRAAAADMGADPRARAAALRGLEEEMECGLRLVGVAAIEDQLQEGVPEAIATLRAAGIRLWVITGDKLETAVNIARAGALVSQPRDEQLLVLRAEGEAAIRGELAELRRQAAAICERRSSSSSSSTGRGRSRGSKVSGGLGGGAGVGTGPPLEQAQRDGPTPKQLGPRTAAATTAGPPGASAASAAAAAAAAAVGGAREVAMAALPPQRPYGGRAGGGAAAAAPASGGDDRSSHSGGSGGASDGSRGGGAAAIAAAAIPAAPAPTAVELVVDGRSLEWVLERPRLAASLAGLCAACEAVVVCRASPGQKASLVRLMRRHRRAADERRRRRRWAWLWGRGAGARRWGVEVEGEAEQRRGAVAEAAVAAAMVRSADSEAAPDPAHKREGTAERAGPRAKEAMGPSPDEVALLEAARQMGFELAAREPDAVQLRVQLPYIVQPPTPVEQPPGAVQPPPPGGELVAAGVGMRQDEGLQSSTEPYGGVEGAVQQAGVEVGPASSAAPAFGTGAVAGPGAVASGGSGSGGGGPSTDGGGRGSGGGGGGGGGDGGGCSVLVRYRVLHVLEFSSARKRMSVVVEAPDGSLALHSKGADSAADVGIGLLGKEGRQAVNNSDVALPLFRHLVPLLLVHGQLSCERLSRLITYSFYKNLAAWGVLVAYQFYCGFSGQALIDDISGSFYNVVFTAAPILVVALQESLAPHPSRTLLSRPDLYNARPQLSAQRFWLEGLLLPLAHSAACFFVPLYAATPHGILPVHTLWAVGKTAYVALIGAVTAELLLTTRAHTRLLAVVCGLSVALVFPFMLLVVWRLELASDYLDETTVGVADALFASPYFWLSVAAAVALTAGSRYIERAVRWLYLPDPYMILAREHQRAAANARTPKHEQQQQQQQP
ncbi:putative phospholipid-transporting ATPase VA, partial [Tetrabaena socialis]